MLECSKNVRIWYGDTIQEAGDGTGGEEATVEGCSVRNIKE